MVTYRSVIWNALIEFIDKLKDFPNFETMENGKLKNRLEYLYNRAIERMRFDKSDFDLLSRTFIYLSEKDVESELVEAMNENINLGYKCITTRDGEKIIKEALDAVQKRKIDDDVKQKLAEAERRFAEAEEKRKAYNAEHDRITEDFESAKIELDLIRQAAEEMKLSKEEEPKEKKSKVITKEVEEIKEQVLTNETEDSQEVITDEAEVE